MRMRNSLFVLLLMSALQGIAAQDRRSVSEPHLPSLCTKLRAELRSDGPTLHPNDEEKLDTARLQHGLDTCLQGHAVQLARDGEHNAFLSGPLNIPPGITLLVDSGVTLFASRDPKLYERHSGSCGVMNDEPSGCRPLISVEHAPHAAVMGDGVIDGRGGSSILHGSISWWELAEQARSGGHQQVPRILVVDGSDDFTAYRITLRNSPNFGLVYSNGRGFTAWGVHIEAPGRAARNTDGIDPGSASDITIAHSIISTGDDHVAIKGSGSGVHYMSVLDNQFYRGHGMSIGSETFAGISDVLVRGLTIDGADNGLRIKSNVHRGGLVERIRYEDVCIRNTKNPITMDTRYDKPGADNSLIPHFREVLFRNIAITGGGKLTVVGNDAAHASEATFDNIRVDDREKYKLLATHAHLRYGPGPVDLQFQGEDVSSSQVLPRMLEPAHRCGIWPEFKPTQ